MSEEIIQWVAETRHEIRTHAPDYLSDFMSPRSHSAASYTGMNDEQSSLIGSFDVYRTKLNEIRKEIRGR
jgi:hypothetical protein